jgi:tRNA A-37 threonylcarbamoyl transferase component Bud32
VSAVIGAVALGIGAAATIHLIFGSGVGIPSKARIVSGLRGIGLDVTEVEYFDDQPVGTSLLRGSVADNTVVQVRVYGRDAADAATTARLWRQLWYLDDDRSLTASGLQQAEHESLMLHEGREADLAVPSLVTWGKGEAGDAFVVTRWLDGERFGDLEHTDIDDVALGRCWRTLDELHDTGLVHRSIDCSRVVVGPDRVVLDDLAAAQASTDPQSRAADMAQMLVATIDSQRSSHCFRAPCCRASFRRTRNATS